MPIIVTRPDGTLQEGLWAKVGPPGITMHGCLNDDSDLTYIEVNQRVQTDAEIAKLTIQDFDVPDGAKIFAVRSRIRVQKIQATPEDPDPPTPHPHCGFHMHGFIGLLIEFIFRILFGFRCPRKPPKPDPTEPPDPPEWTTVELSYYLEQPGGGEWTEQSFNDFFVSMGRTDTDDVVLRVSEILVDLDYNERPSVTPNGPVGPLVDITLPTIQWLYEDPESDKQQAFRVRIFTDDVYTAPSFDPETAVAFDETAQSPIADGDGWIKGEDVFWGVNRDHPNGTYRAYVQVEQVWSGIGRHFSEWNYWQWVQDVPGPPEPLLTATYEPDLNRVRLDLHEGGPSPATDTYNLEFSDNLGVTWALVRNGLQVDIDDVRDSRIYDYEAPSGRLRLYRGAAYRILNSIMVTSGYSNEASAIPLTDDWWLKDPLVPALNIRLWVHEHSSKRPRSRGVFSPLVSDLNRQARKIIVSGPQYGWEGDLTAVFIPEDDGTEDSWEKFQVINDPGRVLLLQAPNGEQWYVSLGDLDQSQWGMRWNDTQYRKIGIPWTETYAPRSADTGEKR